MAAGCADTYVDTVLSSEVRDVFKNGWKAREAGATISFEFTGGELAVMYRKSVKKPAPAAYAVIDGDEEQRIELDANSLSWNCFCIGKRLRKETSSI